MARVKGGVGAKKKHNRTLKLAKGYRGARSKLTKSKCNEQNTIIKKGVFQRAVGWCETVYVFSDYPLRAVH